MKLDTKTWKEFFLKDYFDIVAGKYHYPSEYESGTTPYVSASNENNGISQKIDLVADFHGNAIVTGKVGCTAFYQPNDFCATSDVNVFYPKFQMNERMGLFIVTIINFNENYKWSYGRQCRVGDSNEIVVKLPATEKGEPDWQFMDNYIKSINHKPITTKNSGGGGCLFATLGKTEWKDYKLGELFEKIYKAEANVKGELEISDKKKQGYINFITRTEENNGCDCYVKDDTSQGKEKGKAIIIGDTTSTCFYQEEDFYSGDHIVVCRAKWINKYTAIFLKTLLERERYRYSYGRAFKMDLIKETVVKLPTKEGKPDFLFMENYIKSLPYGDRI